MIFLIRLAYPCFLCVCLVLYVFLFVIITYLVGADVVAVSKALLEDEEPSF